MQYSLIITAASLAVASASSVFANKNLKEKRYNSADRVTLSSTASFPVIEPTMIVDVKGQKLVSASTLYPASYQTTLCHKSKPTAKVQTVDRIVFNKDSGSAKSHNSFSIKNLASSIKIEAEVPEYVLAF